MITSISNDLIKKCIRIKQKKFSKDLGLCFVESIKIVKELYDRNLVDLILVTSDKKYLIDEMDCKVEIIDDKVAKALSETVTTDGVFAICRIPSNISKSYKKCLVLDRIQDPSNLGAIIRSACAFGFTTIFTINSVYPYSAKSIRSSMGYVFNVDFIDVDYDMLSKIKTDNNITFYAADMNGELIDNINEKDENLAIIIGNEGQGLSENLRMISDKTVSIPMLNGVESLNASISASIIMYFLK